MQLQGKLSVERMCQLTGVSRAGFYRHLVEVEPDEEEMAVRDAIQRIYLEHRRHYGYRRITAELHHRGMLVNRKRVARLMQQDNLVAVTNRKYVVPTTDSRHDFEVYLNLAARMEVTAVNQLWVADITYIRLLREFVFLAVILDAYSRWWWAGAWLGACTASWRKPRYNRRLSCVGRSQAWCTIPMAECSTPVGNTRICSRRTA
jgi:hypothetical protein